ncbi:hypothetical protein SLE2022_128820 [Rubroshorea leprosula]
MQSNLDSSQVVLPLGEDNLLEIPLSQEFSSIRGKDRNGCGSSSRNWKRLDYGIKNSSSKEKNKHGKQKYISILVEGEKASKVLIGNLGVALVGMSKGHDLPIR